MTNTNTVEAAVILAFVPRTTRATQRRRTCSSVRFRTTTSNISPSMDLSVEHGTARPAAASGGTCWAGLAASAPHEDLDLEIEDA
jgi:hypothetical protein